MRLHLQRCGGEGARPRPPPTAPGDDAARTAPLAAGTEPALPEVPGRPGRLSLQLSGSRPEPPEPRRLPHARCRSPAARPRARHGARTAP